MKLPDINASTDCRSYFRQFLEENKLQNPKFSRRYWAKKLNWPISYFDQVIKGQKSFSVRRCVEFIQFSKMDSLSAEKLLFLVFKSDSDDTVKKYASDKLKKEVESFELMKKTLSRSSEKAFWTILTHEILGKMSHLPTPTEIKNLLYSFPNLVLEEIEEALEYLLKNKIVSVDERNRITNHVAQLHCVAEENSDWKDWAKFYVKGYESGIAACKSNIPHLAASHGFIRLPNDRLEDVRAKLFALADSLHNITPLSSTENFDSNNSTLVQYGLSIFPILKKEAQ